MAWLPIALTVPQYENSTTGLPYSGAVLKAYIAGTSTNTPFATDTTGATQANSIALNAAGYPAVSGNVVIPHIDRSYKLSLYPTQAAADSDSGAIWTVDNLTPPSSGNSIAGVNSQTVTYTLVGTDNGKLILFTGAGGVELDLLSVDDAGANFTFYVENNTSGTVTLDPDAAELINGAASLVLQSGECALVICTGSAWRALIYLNPATSHVFAAAQTVRIDDATTNDVTTALTVSHTTSGTPANNIGVGINFEAETAAGNNEVGASIDVVATDTTSTSEDFKISFKTMKAGAAKTEAAYIAQGLVMIGVIGGDQGEGTGNFTEIYRNGASVGTALSLVGLVGPLATKTASSSASISFNSSDGISSTYNEYWVQLEHVVPTTSGNSFLARLDTNDGASFDAGATDYIYRNTGIDVGNNDQATGSTGTTSVRITGGASGVSGTANNGGLNGWVKFQNVNSTAGRKMFRYELNYFTSTNVACMIDGIGCTNSTTLRDAAVNAFQFLTNGDPIASGIFRLFGVKKS